MSETLDNVAGEAKRPSFLTVLCVLTFIGSGLSILTNLAWQDPGIADYAGYYYWVQLLFCVGTLYGALQMWKMQKMGLYIWTAAEALSLILMWVVYKGYLASLVGDAAEAAGTSINSIQANMVNEAAQSTLNIFLVIFTIFPAIFILLYWLNAKHLK